MKHKLNHVMGFALAGLLAMAPVGLAAGDRPVGPSSARQTPGTTQMQSPGMSTQAGDSIHATVQRVNPRKHTVELKASDGERVRLPAPSQMLSELKPGDTVELSIHKTSGMPERGSSGATARPVNPPGPPSESSGPTD
jgi:hypothetical protein